MQQSPLLSRKVESRFNEFRGRAEAFAEELRRLSEQRLPSDAAENARGDIDVIRTTFTKWTLEILVVLYCFQAMGFEELRRQLRGISPRVLSGRLKSLEARNLVVRRVLNDRPPRVQYRLSQDGLTLARLGEPVLLFLRLRLRPPKLV